MTNTNRADGINALLMAWVDTALCLLNDYNIRREYKRIFASLSKTRNMKLFSSYSPDGGINYVRNPLGILVCERWTENPTTKTFAFTGAYIYGYGRTPGSALIQGKPYTHKITVKLGALEKRVGDVFIYAYFNLRRMSRLRENRLEKHYRCEKYRLKTDGNLVDIGY